MDYLNDVCIDVDVHDIMSTWLLEDEYMLLGIKSMLKLFIAYCAISVFLILNLCVTTLCEI